MQLYICKIDYNRSLSRSYFRRVFRAVPTCNALLEFILIFSYSKNVEFAWSLA